MAIAFSGKFWFVCRYVQLDNVCNVQRLSSFISIGSAKKLNLFSFNVISLIILKLFSLSFTLFLSFHRLVGNVCVFNFVRPPCLVLNAILFLSAAYLFTKHVQHELKLLSCVVNFFFYKYHIQAPKDHLLHLIFQRFLHVTEYGNNCYLTSS